MASISTESSEIKEEVAAPKAATKSSKYRCITKCYWEGKLYLEGEVIESDAKDVPVHFEKLK